MIAAESAGQVGNVMLLITNGGPHPPDKWAYAAAVFTADLVQFDEKSNSNAAAQARRGKPVFVDSISSALEPMFLTAMTDEQDRIDNNQVTHRTDPFAVDGYLNGAVNAVVTASHGSPFTSHFAKQATQDVVRNILKQVFIDAANSQRSWAFDAKGL